MGPAKLRGTCVARWSRTMAGALVSVLPIPAVCASARKRFAQGIVMSGVKD